MKYNPRINEEMSNLPGFAAIHPLQPESTAQGALEVIQTLEKISARSPAWIVSPCSLQPAPMANSPGFC